MMSALLIHILQNTEIQSVVLDRTLNHGRDLKLARQAETG